ncbi:MAG: manganese efflux pump MntP family protein [Clostridia bacterium]|nr:manganese efflux pump MntP family protein [Clostridia bacterium]
MEWNLLFFLNCVLFGVGLAMDAFSVSMANGLNEPDMKKNRMCLIAGVFCGFQIIMPLAGWVCVHTIATVFEAFQRFIPWIALALLLFIGGKMLLEGIRYKDGDGEKPAVGFGALIVQGIATSIDALSVGFTIAGYPFSGALVESLIIGVVTFAICIGGLLIGRRFGTKLAGKASILGGVILIAIGLEIFLTGVL